MSSSSPRSRGRRSSPRNSGSEVRSSSPARSPARSPSLYDAQDARSSSPAPHGPQSSPVRGSINTSSPLPYASQSTPINTPVRPRSELGTTPRHRREFDPLPSTGDDLNRSGSTDGMTDGMNAVTSEAGPISRTVIWGTNVNVQDTEEKFRQFILNFVGADAAGGKYVRLLTEAREAGIHFLNVDCADIRSHDDTLYQQVVRYPQEVIPILDLVINDIYHDKFPDELEIQLQVRPFNLVKTVSMRELDPEDIDQLISVQGMVIRTSQVIPDMKEGFFECLVCGHTATVEIEQGNIAEPTTCSRCQSRKSYQLIHNRCKFADRQMIKLQETPESIPDGQTPQTVLSYGYDELVDDVQPGDRITVTGVYRATPLRVIARQRTCKSVYKTHIDVVHFAKVSGTRMRRTEEDAQQEDPVIRAERIQKIEELAAQPDVYDRLTRALAPNIYEFDDVKKGVLLQLFGGTDKSFKQSGRGRFRGEINVLLCGDPGTSKSQMLQYAVKIAARGIYTSGKGSSAVGLTAYVTKDPETKQHVLESGALVLCDGGVCCIDEFDKMPESTRSVLHEAMEQQTVSIAKAGIICSLNARTSILAAANPVESRWNRSMSVTDNLRLPPTLLSRFDLIYLILDTPDKNLDRRLATHLVEMYYSEDERTKGPEPVNRDLLAGYISYARETVQPKMSEEAARDLVAAYVEMRKLGNSKGTISATPRQLESLIRLSEAHARVRLSEEVEKADVAEATRLVKAALRQAATDPRTGQIDMDLITTGQSMAARTKIGNLSKAIIEVLSDASGKSLTLTNMLDAIQSQSDVPVTIADIRECLPQLMTDDEIQVQGGLRAANPKIVLI